jgi:hypothetical protein
MKTTITENFLTDDQLNNIETLFRQYDDLYIEKEKLNIRMSDTHLHADTREMRAIYWYPGDSVRQQIQDILNPKIAEIFGKDIICTDWHILNAYKPYNVHSDSLDDDVPATFLDDTRDYAWTFLIPLGNYNTNTIVFNEHSYNTKTFTKWVERTHPTVKQSIDQITYDKYLTHQNKEDINYLSIDTIFPWKKGNLLAMNRHSLHASDNFCKKGVFEKRALIAWSTRKIK